MRKGASSYLVATTEAERAAAIARLVPAGQEGRVAPCAPGELLLRARAARPAAVFLDTDGPGDPFGHCRRLRGTLARWRCAIVAFGGETGTAAVVRALDAGADDYWAYPFDQALCRAYLRSILRRVVPPPGPEARAVRCSGLELDEASGEARCGGTPLRLRAKEFAVLFALLSRPGEVVTREDLLRDVWGFDDYGTSRAIDFHVSQLRKKLGDRAAEIETVPGRGYRFHRPSNKNLT